MFPKTSPMQQCRDETAKKYSEINSCVKLSLCSLGKATSAFLWGMCIIIIMMIHGLFFRDQ